MSTTKVSSRTTTRKKNAPLSMTSLQANLRAGKKGEVPEQRFIATPTIARYILENLNTGNRSLNEPHLTSLVRDITNGRWVESSGSMILFDKNGKMIDGQHRLAAIVRSKTPLSLSFKFGLDEEAQRVIDTGRKRTYSDLIAMTEGLRAKYKMERASVTRLLYGFLHDQTRPHVYTNNNKPTQSDLYEVAQEFHEDIYEAVSRVHAPGLVPKVVIGSYASFVYLLAKNSDNGERVSEFFDLLGSGANLDNANPIMVVRNRLMLREEFRNQKNKDRTLGLLVKGWNLWVNGENTTNKMHNPDHLIRMVGLDKLGKHALYK